MATARSGRLDLELPQRLVVSRDEPQHLLALAQDAKALDGAPRRLLALTRAGHTVTLLWWHGTPGAALAAIPTRHQLAPAAPSPARGWLRSQGQPPPESLLAALRADPQAGELLARADALILLGPRARDLEQELATPERPVVPGEELNYWRDLTAAWDALTEAVEKEVTNELVDRLLALADHSGGRVPLSHQPLLVRMVDVLYQRGEWPLATRLAEHLDPRGATDQRAATHLAGLRALVRTSAAGQEDPGLREAARQLLAEADLALAASDLDDTVTLTTLALELLFHRELHADQLTSPLVEDPDGFLADWRGSQVGQLFGRGRPRRPARARPGGGTDHVVVSPGSFPQFATPLVEALREGRGTGQPAEVEVLELGARPALRWLGVNRTMVERALHEALGTLDDLDLDLELVAQLEGASSIFCDWADPAALEVVLSAPAGVPLTVRIHSMDALAAWVHLIDWHRVDDLIVVSEHLREALERLLGERLARTRVHVVPNVVEVGRISTARTGEHRRHLLMIGWGQRVKDPLWALEVLGLLRAEDPAWTLTLLGADFQRGKFASVDRYQEEFVDRLVRDDVRDAVELVDWTPDIAGQLERAGFILSLSRRESFGLGMIEGAASGAVPVVRDWPIFARLGGAGRIVPQDWVVTTVEEAVERIRRYAEEPAWEQESARARAEVAARYGEQGTLERLCSLILGR